MRGTFLLAGGSCTDPCRDIGKRQAAIGGRRVDRRYGMQLRGRRRLARLKFGLCRRQGMNGCDGGGLLRSRLEGCGAGIHAERCRHAMRRTRIIGRHVGAKTDIVEIDFFLDVARLALVTIDIGSAERRGIQPGTTLAVLARWIIAFDDPADGGQNFFHGGFTRYTWLGHLNPRYCRLLPQGPVVLDFKELAPRHNDMCLMIREDTQVCCPWESALPRMRVRKRGRSGPSNSARCGSPALLRRRIRVPCGSPAAASPRR